MTKCSPFTYFATSPKFILLAMMWHIRVSPPLRNAEDLPLERGIGTSYKSVRFKWQLLASITVAESCKKMRRSHSASSTFNS